MGYLNCMYTNDYDDIELIDNEQSSNEMFSESNLSQEEMDAIKE